MWPLWACSIALVALVLERMRALKAGRILDEGMVEEVAALTSQMKMEEARQACRKSPTVVGQAWAQGLHEFSLGGMDLAEALTNATVLAFKPLKRNLRAIATLGVISPLFGLLGTILGMIVIFGEIAATGGADKGKLAGGMGLALFTTAGGLFVAIPAILFNRYLTGRLTGFTERVELAINQVHYRHLHASAQANRTPRSEASGKGGAP
jgi:biopolymer transport protein ExbB